MPEHWRRGALESCQVQKPRFNLVETLGIAALLSFATALVVSHVAPEPLTEIAEYEAKYGPDRQSQRHEEWLIHDFFGDSRDGVFVDVGANDYRRYSNTWYLETALGWSGIASSHSCLSRRDTPSIGPDRASGHSSSLIDRTPARSSSWATSRSWLLVARTSPSGGAAN
jgi:hypothetical protein